MTMIPRYAGDFSYKNTPRTAEHFYFYMVISILMPGPMVEAMVTDWK
jgi:hypothetical protein